MSKLQYYNYPGFGEHVQNVYGYSQVVRIGNELRISGQGGLREDGTFPESEDEQIAIAFENIEKALKFAGLKKPFENIFSIRSLHVSDHYDSVDLMGEHLKRIFTTHSPIWTLIGVERLAIKEMKVEIEVVALADE